jgi:Fe-S-cluster containining protein
MDSALPATVQVDFKMALGPSFGGQLLNLSLPVPAGHTNVTQMLPILQSLTSQLVERVAASVEAAGQHISCKAGCGACCRQIVPLSIFEAEALAQWIASLPSEQQEELRLRFHQALLALRDSGILERITPELWEEGSQDSRTLVLDYLAAKVPCPFLVDESCSIHPIRPLVCREYLVTSPPEFCSDALESKVSGVRMPLKLSKALYQLGAKLENEGSGWIPLVFLFHWIKSGAQPGSRLSGPGPQVMHGILVELES